VSAFYLLDDRDARQFEPFSLTRPVGELRAGIELVRVRWEGVLGLPCTGHLTAPHLAHFTEPGAPPSVSTGMLPAGAIVANARCAPALEEMPLGDLWFCDGRPAAVRLGRELSVDVFRDGLADLASMAPASPHVVAVRGWWMHHVWDFVRQLPDMIAEDIRCVGPSVRRASPGGAIVVGEHEVVIEAGAHIEPLVVLDATAGPILIRSSATVRAFTHLLGPCYIGHESQVGAGRIATSSIGDTCRAHGELSTTIFTGHANKSHEGFVGHSILGRWTNLGASTVTSNLKNTYGSIQLWTPSGLQDTGMQLLGSLVGDHAKTAIGTRLTTGSVIGAGANVVSDGMAPKVIPPFCWGTVAAGTTYELDKFMAVAARAMARRHVTLGERERAYLAAVYHARWSAS
jgi:UDP-N-acetylglucosamine diphosphorylase/glucosamine-1-phosphate N-acetyltransferase